MHTYVRNRIVKAFVLPEPYKHAVHGSTAYLRMRAKAKIIEAMESLRLFVDSLTSVHDVYDSSTPLSFHLRPKKKVTALKDIVIFSPKKLKRSSSQSPPQKQLMLTPQTTNVQTVKKNVSYFLKLPCEVEGTNGAEVVALGRAFQDPLTATDEKVGVVELFWEVRRSQTKSECNMELIECQVCSGHGVTIPGLTLGQLSPHKEIIYAMVPSCDIKAGDELVVYFVDDGEKPIKRARV